MSDHPTARPLGRAWPLPTAPHLEQALRALIPNGEPTPKLEHLTEREWSAMLAGSIAGIMRQIESGLRGGPLEKAFAGGDVSVYDHEVSIMILGRSEQLTDLCDYAFAQADRNPHVDVPYAVAAFALQIAYHALSAAITAQERGHDIDASKHNDEMHALLKALYMRVVKFEEKL